MTVKRVIHFRPIDILRGRCLLPLGALLGLYRAVALALPKEQRPLANLGDPYPFEFRELAPDAGLDRAVEDRLRRIILGADACRDGWRDRFCLRPPQWMTYQRVLLRWRHERPKSDGPHLARLPFSPNPCHPRARSIAGVRFRPSERGWHINLYFGYRKDYEESLALRRQLGLTTRPLGTSWRLSWETHDPAVGLADALKYLQAQEWTVPQGLLRMLP